MNPLKLALFISVIGTSILLSNLPTQASETAILKYKIFREHISVPELSTFAGTGELSPSLKAHLRTAKQKPEDLQRTLNENVDVDPVTLSKFLNNIVGEALLDLTSEVIHTPSKRASRQALRSALVTSALSDRNIQLIEILENYPTSEVYIDGDRLKDVFEQVQDVLGNLPDISF